MNVVKLSTLNSSEVLRLATYLEKFSKTEDKKGFVLAHLGNFFFFLTLEQTVELTDCISNEDEKQLDDFIKRNPDINVNLDGDSKAKEIPGWKVKEEALESIHKLAVSSTHKTSKLKQIIKARDLTCLEHIKPGKYDVELLRSKLLEEYPKTKFQTYIERLKDVIPIKNFLATVFAYYNLTKAEYFVKYVFFYLDIVMLDTAHESQIANAYISKINSIIK